MTNKINNDKNKLNFHIKLMPAQIILIGFAVLVLAGSLLLTLPISSRAGEWTDPLTASFTAVSASCVTGLVAADTATHWSLFGQIVIICMIQIGGLGFMSFALIFSMLIKRRITPRESMIMAGSLGFSSYGGFKEIAVRIVCGTFIIEGLGAVALATRFVPMFGAGKGIYMSIFHSISAFCNAGFDLMGDYSGKFSSLTAFKGDPVVNITIMALIAVGGLGFIVWEDIISYRRNKGLSVYSKLVLSVSAFLIVFGAVFTLFAESANAEFDSTKNSLLASFFQSVSTRTAGFNTVGLEALSDKTKAMYSILMLVGGSSGSTAGGVKTATVAVLFISAVQIACGRKEVTAFKRRIETQNILNALSIFMIAVTLMLTAAFTVCAIDGIGFIDALFECSSAINTVGFTVGIATGGHAISKIILMALMFCGRVGILTLTYSALLRRARRESAMKYPTTNIVIG